MTIVVRIVINALALFFVAYLVPGVAISGFGSALVAAIVLGLVNATLRPILLILTIPINIMTLGLFTFVVNALMLMIVSKVVVGFAISGFWYGLLGAILLSIVSTILSGLAGVGDRRRRR